jgi:hypothetical protein
MCWSSFALEIFSNFITVYVNMMTALPFQLFSDMLTAEWQARRNYVKII